MIRVGQGFDVHQLVEGRKCIIGGVTIPYEKGLLGHSDADVLLHAVSDAILGALGLGDIGKHFPDTAAEFKDADSLVLLKHVWQLAKDKDIVWGIQIPRLLPRSLRWHRTSRKWLRLLPMPWKRSRTRSM